MAETPAYTLEQHLARALLPRILTLFCLSIMFYLAVLLNIALLEMDAEQETMIKIGALLCTLALLAIGIFFAYRHAKQPYLFFSDRIVFGPDTLLYVEIHSTSPSLNIWDKAFKTYSIACEKHFTIRHIRQEVQLEEYLTKMIEYAKRQQLALSSAYVSSSKI